MALQIGRLKPSCCLSTFFTQLCMRVCACVCVRVCVFFFFRFYLLTKQFSTQKWEIGPNSKLRPIICIASQETINRNSLFVPQYRLFNKLVNFFSLCAVRNFLSLPTGNGNACVSRRVHLYVHCHFL